MHDFKAYEPLSRRVALPSRGGEMAFLDFGPARRPVDVVFSHANGLNARTYRSILAPLAGEFRIWALDLRGHGVTAMPTCTEKRTGWIEFCEDLEAFLAATVGHSVVLAGHSMGATSSLLAAAAAPAQVSALALFEPVLTPPSHQNLMADAASRRRADFPHRDAAYAAYRGRGGFRTWSTEQLTDYLEAGLRDTQDGVTLACRPDWEASNFRTYNFDASDAFRNSRCQIHLLRAEVGSTAPVAGHEHELLATGRIRFETVAGTTHFLPMERPTVVQEVIRDLILAS